MPYIGQVPVTGENNNFKILDDITSYTETFNGSSSGVVSVADDTLTFLSHRFITGQRITYSTTGTAIGGLVTATAYFVIKNDQNTIKLATTYANAINNVAINLTALGTGTTHTLIVAFDSINTKFKATFDNGTKALITRAGQLQISINGVIQQPQDTTSPSNGFGIDLDGVIIFSTAPASTDIFWGNVFANNFATFDIADNTVDSFTGNGSQVDFTLSKIPANNQNILVTIDGVVQYPSDSTTVRAYSLSENVLTFVGAPGNATAIQVRHIGFAGATSSSVTGFYGRTGNVVLTSADNVSVGGIVASGIITATSFSGTATTTTNIPNLTGAITSNNTTTSLGSFTSANLATALTDETGTGAAVFATSPTLVTPVLGAATATSIVVSSGSTFTNGPILVGSATSTGTSSQNLQVIGGGYFSNSVGIGTTNPRFSLEVGAVGASGTSLYVNGDARVTGILSVGQGTITINGNTDKITAPKFEYAGISSTITATATDVFVYDTRKDSDGGAWRKRTQHTSWYNETLNTATRGSRRDFPAVAVIVCKDWGFTIYDADDPDMPMWASYTYVSWDKNVNSIVARDGKICFTIHTNASYSGNGFGIFDYIKDRQSRNYIGNYINFKNGFINDLISSKRSSTTYLETGDNVREFGLTNYNCNDVAITVLPNAPIDPSTGLPVPTIAIACGTSDSTGAVSIINDNGTVSNITTLGSSVTFYTVRWIDNTRLYAGSIHISGVIGFRHYILNYPSLTTERIEGHSYDDTGLNWSTGLITGLGGGIFGNRFATIKDGFAVGYGEVYTGLNLINYDSVTNGGMFAYIKSNYNTGWMHGDIKGAWLSDTSTASVTGTELITNGNFSTSDLSAWTTINGGTAQITGGLLKLTDTSNAFVYASAPFTTVVGKKYVVTFDIVNGGDNTANYNYVRIGNSHNSTEHHDTNYGVAYGKYQVTITASATTTYITLINGLTNGFFGYWDNISVRLAEADRSVNNKGLAVYGTITKTPVATGADLVAYSGFSASNYLQQPYNSALDFGTGNYSIIFWINSPSIATDQSIFTLGDYTQVNSLQLLVLNSSGNGNSLSYSEVGSPVAFLFGPHEDNGWIQIAIVRNGITVSAYINGILKTTVSNANPTNINLSNATHKNLVIGAGSHSGTIDYSYSGSISLFRISATAPSPDQITKIYNDEKMLFQENSKATLYGNSSAVTALAYDDSTRLLYAGTSSGRSEFQGLRRINNTTTAVTTAISASNGLIAEQ